MTGFDEKAIFYCRKHDSQLNIAFLLTGIVVVKLNRSLLREWDLVRKWQDHFGTVSAVFLAHNLIRQELKASAECFMHCIYAFSWAGAWRILCDVWYSWHFWKMIPHAVWIKKWVLKVTLRKIFRK